MQNDSPATGPDQDRNAIAQAEREVNVQREKARSLDRQLATAAANNRKLVDLLERTRGEIATLRAGLDRDGETPFNFATIVEVHPRSGFSAATSAAAEGSGSQSAISTTHVASVDILHSGRKMRVSVSPLLDIESLRVGQEVLLNEALVVVAALGFEATGEIVTVKEILDEDRVVAIGRGDDQRVVRIGAPLRSERLRVGDAVVLDARTSLAMERVQLTEMQSLILEEVPDISYEDIGGLGPQIEQIRDAVELPFIHQELFAEHGLSAPKGILLYGPPGCGKTLIAKAVARSLADRAVELTGTPSSRSYFLNIKGPELLDKYVGETERHIRLIFARAREKAATGDPVVVFFDEMDALFRTRGSGVSSDVETTIVPQLLTEIDGVEKLDNVIVIGASNREDMIDPAILRPGRLDVKIRVQRPTRTGASEIFAKYLTEQVPLHRSEVERDGGDASACVRRLIATTVEQMYASGPENEFLELTFANGVSRMLYFRDFASGAVIRNIVDRAKKAAIKDLLTGGERGVTASHLREGVIEEFHEHEDLPNTSNPDDWARISGQRGERVTHIRPVVHERAGERA
ncbi:proteasome ATPase [Zhihengliuella salsuginis]|uniref:AAA ATPase forming ring-shaped complexes n=1 Tax=Zhihengliuella salsuginis TaxID=578222 RepID=A0ABQ3GML9_9MICC|nr:proteasome ATPase [Zhihengliuella salsuginis]GHD12751.1 proteasome-associated ATPase [Zhihengliuella salsuginis]